jgi:hypothetical protein
MKLKVELNEQDIRDILSVYINNEYGTNFTWQELPIQVRSKQNYGSEWEEAEIKIEVQVIRK